MQTPRRLVQKGEQRALPGRAARPRTNNTIHNNHRNNNHHKHNITATTTTTNNNNSDDKHNAVVMMAPDPENWEACGPTRAGSYFAGVDLLGRYKGKFLEFSTWGS